MNSSTLLLLTTILASASLLHACCNTCNTNCCSTCQNQCSTSRCVNNCQNRCCTATPECTTSPTTARTTVETETVTPVRNVETPTPVRNVGTPFSTSQNSSNQMRASIQSTNIMNNQNGINIRVGVSSNVVNNINNSAPAAFAAGRNESTVVTVPVVVKVPVCWENCTGSGSTTTPMTPVTTPEGNRTHCCVVIVPCATHGCNPYHYRCQGCGGRVGYLPLDPCRGGCHRRPVWNRERCMMGQCFSRQVDCSHCQQDFYETYEGYSSCHGCFYGQ